MQGANNENQIERESRIIGKGYFQESALKIDATSLGNIDSAFSNDTAKDAAR